MMMRYCIYFVLVVMLGLGGCSDKKEETKASNLQKPELLFYVGITMVKPMAELAKRFEAKEGVSIKILQGGSEDLYQSAKISQSGDLYMPGSLDYRDKYLPEGVLDQDAVFVGYNRASLMIKKGNPKNIKADLSVLLDSKYRTVLCNPESGSIGHETKIILDKANIYIEAMARVVYLTTDSRNLIKAIKDDDADVVLNWRATAFGANKEVVEVLDLPASVAKKEVLVLTLLKSSKQVQKTREFMAFARSLEGRTVFHQFGFLSDEELANFDSLTF